MAGPLPQDTADVVAEKKEDVKPEDLTTQAVAQSGAERSFKDRLEQVQEQKKALNRDKTKVTPDTGGYQQTPPMANKKAVKREGQVAAEVQESVDLTSNGSWDRVEVLP